MKPNREERLRKKKKPTGTMNLTLLISVSLMLVLAIGAFFFVRNSSGRIVSSVSDVYQGILEERSKEISSILFEKNPYLSPDRYYLAKLLPVFYGLSDETGLHRLLETGAVDDNSALLAISNICTNIKKGISYSNSLRSCYWMLADKTAPYVLVNGNAALKSELLDSSWINECFSAESDWQITWRELPLSYLNSVKVLTVQHRFESESFIEGQSITGYMVLNYNLSNIMNSIAAALSSTETMFLYDSVSGEMLSVGTLELWEPERKALMTAAIEACGQSAKIGTLRLNNDTLFYRIEELSSGVLSIVCMKNAQISHALDSTILSITLIMILCCIAVVAVNIHSLIRYHRYSNGLKKMFNALRNHSDDHSDPHDLRESPQQKDLLARILNNEIDLQELQGLVESKQELKAELDALYGHVQINSHFLLNTLDSIYWTSVSHNGADSRESTMIGDLCEILKYALDSSDLYTSLREEVECAKKYIKIQTTRKNLHVSVEWDIPDMLMNARVGKLILQPVIENCIQHGFQDHLDAEAMIRITAERMADEGLLIRVEDNGRGMSAAQIAQMNAELKKQRYTRSRHIGMANVNRRLQVQFGGDSGVKLLRLPSGGLCVCLIMSCDREKMQTNIEEGEENVIL